jgi:hypothetical protein
MPVVVTNSDLNMLAASVQTITDGNRIATIMERRTPASARRYTAKLGLDFHARSCLLPMEPSVGIEFERWCLSVPHPEGNLYFWLLNDASHGVRDVESFTDEIGTEIENMLMSWGTGEHRSEYMLVDKLVQEDAIECSAAMAEAGMKPASIEDYDVAALVAVEGRARPELDGLLASQIREALASPFAVVGADSNCLIVITKTSGRARTLGRLSHLTNHYGPGELSIGISPARPRETTLYQALQRADFLGRIGALPEGPRIMQWEKAGAWRTLFSTEWDSLDIDEVRPGLGSLTTNTPHLASSARVYLESSSAEEAAQRLFVHRTTLYNHLSKINDLLGEGWDKGWDRVGVHAALQLNRLAQSPGRFASNDTPR